MTIKSHSIIILQQVILTWNNLWHLPLYSLSAMIIFSWMLNQHLNAYLDVISLAILHPRCSPLALHCAHLIYSWPNTGTVWAKKQVLSLSYYHSKSPFLVYRKTIKQLTFNCWQDLSEAYATGPWVFIFFMLGGIRTHYFDFSSVSLSIPKTSRAQLPSKNIQEVK